jgi:hypothetical protein
MLLRVMKHSAFLMPQVCHPSDARYLYQVEVSVLADCVEVHDVIGEVHDVTRDMSCKRKVRDWKNANSDSTIQHMYRV